MGVARDGSGRSLEAAEGVVAEIKAKGGDAIAAGVDVGSFPEVEKMVADALCVGAASTSSSTTPGVLRDKTWPRWSSMNSGNCSTSI